MKNFLLTILALAVAAFIGAAIYFQESPQQVIGRVSNYINEIVHPRPASTPMPVQTPTPTPEPKAATPVPTPTATPAPEPTATPAPAPVEPLTWMLKHKGAWPREVALREVTEFPAVIDGKVVGSVKLPAGTLVQMADFDGKSVSLVYSGGGQLIPASATDLSARAAVAMSKAEVSKTEEQSAKAETATGVVALASPSPAVSPETNKTDMEKFLADSRDTKSGAFVHPGLLHDEEDFKRMRSHMGREPWKDGWERLIKNYHAQLGYKPRPVERVVRGRDRAHTEPENYRLLFNDIAAAYACALRWRISGDKAYADKSVEILNAWSSNLKQLGGSTDVCLAAGIYGYEFANAAEIMRTYKGWKPEDFARFQNMMLTVFYPINHGFLEHHNGTRIDHYWANWDLCNMASLMAIGVLCDKRSIYNDAVNYFKHGKGNGAIGKAVYYIHPDGLGQWQEAGRDQGHTVMGIGIMGAICEMAWKQGDDLYGYDNNRFLAGCEYVAKYNLGEDVPYKTYTNSDVKQEIISAGARGNERPVWELVYNHYVKLKGLPAPYTAQMAEKVRPEGGGGDYGPNSGGFDQIGYGTLTATLDPQEIKKTATSSWPFSEPKPAAP